MERLAFKPTVRTHPGLRRADNEDGVFGTPRLLAVADGVGGAVAGEMASGVAIDVLAGLEKCWLAEPLSLALDAAVRHGNERIGFIADCRPQLAGMGTTVTTVAIDDAYVVANVGDSRSYLFRDGVLIQLTRDDSLVQELLDAGAIDVQAAGRHPQRHVVLQVLDGDPTRKVAVQTYAARIGDRLLLCSDGLSDYVDRAAIVEALAIPSPEESADRMIELALDAGGRDNVSVVIADVLPAGGSIRGWRPEPEYL